MNPCTNIIGRIKQEWVTILVFFLMWIDMMYMHYVVYIREFALNVENGRFRPCYFSLFDVLFVLSLCSIISFNRKRLALSISFIIIFIVSVSNVVYSRIFGQYMIPDVVSEVSNFKGCWWVSYIGQVTALSDILLLATAITAILCIVRFIDSKEKISAVKVCLILFLSFFLFICSFVRKDDFSLSKLDDYKKMELYIQYDKSFHRELTCNQKPLVCRNGLVRTVLMDYLLFHRSSQSLTDEDVTRIDKYWEQRRNSCGCYKLPSFHGSPNVLFIIVESYLSASVNLKSENDIEITPNINRLVNSSHSYSNLCIKSNKGGGQSSDAQVSYFTGLLPIKNQHTVLDLLRDECIALPALLKEQKGYNTYISVPTMASFWHQIEADCKYGIDTIHAYGNSRNNYWCQDKELFCNLIRDLHKLKEPYFHTVLTLSMHAPYYEDTLKTEILYPSDFSSEFCSYLDKCHYTDAQIGEYLNAMAGRGKLDNTVVVIAADHEPDIKQLNMPKNYFKEEYLPLIIYSPLLEPTTFYSGQANQVDVMPTMMDLLDINGNWRGFGHSLFDSIPRELVADDYSISEEMIEGNYFKETRINWK